MSTSKPTVRIGDRYEFSCDDGENTTVGTLAGTYEDKINSLRFEMMEGHGFWTQININDKWLSANDVTVLEYAPLSPKKPAVSIGMDYQFSDNDNPVDGQLLGLTGDQQFHIRLPNGNVSRRLMVLINGTCFSTEQVVVIPTDQRNANEDSESIRSAETIQSLREENAKLLERIQKLKIAVVVYETAITFTGSRDSLAMAREQIAYTVKAWNGGAK